MSDTQPTPSAFPLPINLANLSPAMRQYRQFKDQHPGYVLFFRMGDFYEMFWEDARVCARVLGVALTSRNKGSPDEIPMAGVPYHAVEGYLRKMIAAGHRVALCEQVEDPSAAKGLVRREVVRLMTPGTLTDDALMDGRADNHLAAVAFHVTKSDGYRAALAWVELSTGACVALSGTEAQVLDEAVRLRPAEVLIPEQASGQPHPIGEKLTSAGLRSVTPRPGWQFTPHHAREQVQRQWGVKGTGGFGFADDDPAVLATAAVLSYWRRRNGRPAPATCGRCGGTAWTTSWRSTRRRGGRWRWTAPCAPAGPRAACCRPSTGRGRRWGRGRCDNGCGTRCATRSTSVPGRRPSRRCWRRRRRWGRSRRRWTACATWSGSSAAWPWAGRGRATWPP